MDKFLFKIKHVSKHNPFQFQDDKKIIDLKAITVHISTLHKYDSYLQVETEPLLCGCSHNHHLYP